MKEASGELNMTVVTVVAIAAVAAFFYAFVWPTVKKNIEYATKCSNAICSDCEPTGKGGKMVCHGCTDAGNPGDENTFDCQYANEEQAAGAGGWIKFAK